MVKALGGKVWTIAGICFAILILLGLIVYGAQSYIKLDMTISRSVFLEGEYSVDGGEWKPTDGYAPINERFHKITFKGKMSEFTSMYSENITVSSQNVWYTLKTTDGKPVFELTYVGKEDLRQMYISTAENPNDPMFEPKNFDLLYSEGYASKVSLPDTPGYKTITVYGTTLNADGKLGGRLIHRTAIQDESVPNIEPEARAGVYLAPFTVDEVDSAVHKPVQERRILQAAAEGPLTLASPQHPIVLFREFLAPDRRPCIIYIGEVAFRLGDDVPAAWFLFCHNGYCFLYWWN